MNFQNKKLRTWLALGIFIGILGELTPFTQFGKDVSHFFLHVFEEREVLVLPAQALTGPLRLVSKIKHPNYIKLDIHFSETSEPTQNYRFLETIAAKNKLKVDQQGPYMHVSFQETFLDAVQPALTLISDTIRPNREEGFHLYMEENRYVGGYFDHGRSFQTKRTVPLLTLAEGVQLGSTSNPNLIEIKRVRAEFGKTMDTTTLFFNMRCFLGVILLGLLVIFFKVKEEE